jgi:hypothetical protein
MTTKTAPTTETYPVTLDPTVSLDEQIKAGNYGYVNTLYKARNFKLTLAGSREIVLFDAGGSVTSETMIARMKAEGFIPATLDDALAMGAKYPTRQKKNPIVFLGTVFRGPGDGRRVPVLGNGDGKRGLNLNWFDDDWFLYFRFAAVRE